MKTRGGQREPIGVRAACMGCGPVRGGKVQGLAGYLQARNAAARGCAALVERKSGRWSYGAGYKRPARPPGLPAPHVTACTRLRSLDLDPEPAPAAASHWAAAAANPPPLDATGSATNHTSCKACSRNAPPLSHLHLIRPTSCRIGRRWARRWPPALRRGRPPRRDPPGTPRSASQPHSCRAEGGSGATTRVH